MIEETYFYCTLRLYYEIYVCNYYISIYVCTYKVKEERKEEKKKINYLFLVEFCLFVSKLCINTVSQMIVSYWIALDRIQARLFIIIYNFMYLLHFQKNR